MPNATPTTSRAARGLAGTVAVPGDKSISHRALMLGALAVGETRVEGLLEGEDVLATAAAMRALGAEVERQNDGAWTVAGVGVGGMAEPAGVLDLGNSGTAARLICGILAGQPFTAFMTGDASLCRRPMNRVIAPLAEAMLSLPSPVISDASAPNTARVTVPEPSAVMSSCSVRSPAVSVISIAALAPVV